MRIVAFLILIIVVDTLPFASASAAGAVKNPREGWFVIPHGSIGVNSQQGTAFNLGVDIGCCTGSAWKAGATGHYSFGERPDDDRAIGGGLFVGYAQVLDDWLVFHAREEVGYLDVRNPIDPEPTSGPTYVSLDGTASITSAGLTVFFGRALALSFGYSYIVGIGDSDLGKGRSGPTIGFFLGF
ncbi:MAG: hypothetical protein H6624_15440 [Bdellovibrionaceae bacterium]|nr:hypothetical protein [Bdellovibrionales bacterium]MCB9085740.1 hypothetical protein [Pseudobdellovibrionaceae bacterium]